MNQPGKAGKKIVNIMKQTIYATGRTGQTIVIQSFLIGSNLKRTMVVFYNGDVEVRFSRNPFCKY